MEWRWEGRGGDKGRQGEEGTGEEGTGRLRGGKKGEGGEGRRGARKHRPHRMACHDMHAAIPVQRIYLFRCTGGQVDSALPHGMPWHHGMSWHGMPRHGIAPHRMACMA